MSRRAVDITAGLLACCAGWLLLANWLTPFPIAAYERIRLGMTRMEVVTSGTDQGMTKLAIYEFDGELLRICHDKDRPSEFVSKPGSGRTLEVWKRAK